MNEKPPFDFKKAAAAATDVSHPASSILIDGELVRLQDICYVCHTPFAKHLLPCKPSQCDDAECFCGMLDES